MPNNYDNSIRSAAVTEIISSKPSFLVRYGISFFFIALCIIAVACWFIKYPDTVNAKAIFTSINAPKTIIANTNGKLVALFVKENDSVNIDDNIGFIEANAKHEDVLLLEKEIKNMEQNVLAGNSSIVFNFKTNNNYQLGELQSSYQTFALALQNYTNYLSNGFYIRKKTMLQNDMQHIKRLHENLLQQKALHEQDLKLEKQNYAANKTLNNEKVIADGEFRNEESKLLGKKMTLPQVTSSIISNEAQQNEKQKEMAELENTIAQQRVIFEQAIFTFSSQMADWKKKYVLSTPIAGKIAFANFLQVNQQVQANQTICYVNPNNSNYFAQIIIPQSNFGKVTIGQKVLLKLPSYPYQEYGTVNATLDFINHIPTDSGYQAKITLTNGLITTYKQRVQFREGLQAQAEIITKDMRLLERFYYNLVKKIE
jgi:multidrug efflux pump subunit AcrA (membrane-fusion protein)